MRARLQALKSAVPPYVLEQNDVLARASRLFRERRDIERLLPVFTNTGIERRYSCVPITWYDAE
ncbi:MAG: type III polyketide synthase, partial [Alphaproteobacteria bacterium]|nr:type III polyketide synthase [Alphaproteobacteria bacterium]